MDRGLFIASSSASNLIERQGIVAQNLANVSTAGFKKVFDRMVSIPVVDQRSTLSGGRAYAVTLTPGIDTRAGALLATGNGMDVALGSDMYLSVSDSAGTEAYTRRGALSVGPDGIVRLPTGQTVRSQEGGELAIPVGYVGAVAEDGTLWAQDPANPANKQELGKIKVVMSKEVSLRLDGLYSVGASETPVDGTRILASGYIEQSNVSSADALAQMIETSRLYELNTKVISAFAALDQKGSELLANWQ